MFDLLPVRAVGCLCGPACDCAVRGVGQGGYDYILGETVSEVGPGVIQSASPSIFASIGNFFGSEFGSTLWKGALTLGTTYAISQLGLGGSRGGGGGGAAAAGGGAGGTGTGAGGGGQPINIQLPAQQQSATPEWVLPVAVVGGLAVVAAALVMSRRRR
jgi:hypothetical protein